MFLDKNFDQEFNEVRRGVKQQSEFEIIIGMTVNKNKNSDLTKCLEHEAPSSKKRAPTYLNLLTNVFNRHFIWF